MIVFTVPSAEIDKGFAPTQTANVEEKTILTFENVQPEVQLYKLGQRLLPIEGGNILLRLRDAPVIQFRVSDQRCDVRNWGLQIPVDQIGDLPRLLARKFLELFSLAEANNLSDSEAYTWAGILDDVDYASFSTERSAPRYMEGRLLSRRPEVTVEWHDGDRQVIPSQAAVSLNLINEGEYFGAFVKWGRGDRIQNIERVIILSPHPLADDTWLAELKPH